MKEILANLFGKDNSEKIPFPEEYQMRIVLYEFNKQQLLEIINKYILKSYHLNLIGNAFRNLNEYSLAENAYKDAIKLTPEFDEPYGNLLSLYISQQKNELFEEVYRQGMHSATKKSFIIYQDGRLSFIRGNFKQSLMAAKCVLTDDFFQDEAAFILGLHSLLSLVKQGEDVENNFNEAIKMWEMGISIFPESQSLKELSEYFEENE